MLQDGARRNNYPAPKEPRNIKKSTAASAVLKPPKEDGGDFRSRSFLTWSLPYLPVLVRLVGLIVKR